MVFPRATYSVSDALQVQVGYLAIGGDRRSLQCLIQMSEIVISNNHDAIMTIIGTNEKCGQKYLYRYLLIRG
jgi:hypothetical protein